MKPAYNSFIWGWASSEYLQIFTKTISWRRRRTRHALFQRPQVSATFRSKVMFESWRCCGQRGHWPPGQLSTMGPTWAVSGFVRWPCKTYTSQTTWPYHRRYVERWTAEGMSSSKTFNASSCSSFMLQFGWYLEPAPRYRRGWKST